METHQPLPSKPEREQIQCRFLGKKIDTNFMALSNVSCNDVRQGLAQ